MTSSKIKTRYVGFVASSIDGRTSLTTEKQPTWTSREDWEWFQKSIKKFEAFLVGRNTFLTAEKSLRRRNTFVISSQPKTIAKEGRVTFVNPETVNIKKLLDQYKSVAVLGGAGIYQYTLDHKMLDEVYVTIEPVIFGRGIEMFKGGTKNYRATLKSTRKLNKDGTILLHYIIKR
jgi:dihydrofolate reductase